MNERDIELKLLANKPIRIESAGEIIFPTIGEIIELDESYYSQMLSSILFKKDNLESQEGLDKLTDFEVIYIYCHKNPDFKGLLFNTLRLLFKEDPVLDYEEIMIKLGDTNRIDESNFAKIQDVVAMANWIKIEKSKEPEFNPANEKAKEMIEQIMKNRKNKPKIKEKINLHSIIAGLTWRSNGIGLKEIMDSTIYQLYMGYFVSQNIDNHYFTLTGVYSGNVDVKQIDMSDLNWAKILEKN